MVGPPREWTDSVPAPPGVGGFHPSPLGLNRINPSLNVVFLVFSYQAHGGKAKTGLQNVENGGPGTVFLYHLVHTHRTLLIDNDGGKPLNKHINYAKLDEEGMYHFYYWLKELVHGSSVS